MKGVLVSLILCAGLLRPGAVTAQTSSIEAVILPVENFKVGPQIAKVQDESIDALVEKIYGAIKPSFPVRPPVSLSLPEMNPDSFKRLMSENAVSFVFNEVRTKSQANAVVGTGGKSPSPGPAIDQRIPVKTDGPFEMGRTYEATLLKDGYVEARVFFQIVRNGNSNAFKFGSSQMMLEPSGKATIGFLIDTTGVGSDAGKQTELRARIGVALLKKHYAFRAYSEQTMDAVLKALADAPRTAAQQGLSPSARYAPLKYVIKLN